MKKYIYILYSACLYMLSTNLPGSDDLTRYDIGSSSPFAEQVMTAELLLDEIETVQNELDELTSTGRLSSSAALAASGFLAALAYNAVQHSETSTPFFLVMWDNSRYEWMRLGHLLKEGINNSIWIAFKIGGLMGYSNYIDTDNLPYLHYKDSINTGFQTLVTGLGLGVFLSASDCFFAKECFGHIYITAKVIFTGFVNLLTAYRMYVYILQTRQEKQDDIFNLQNRLQDAMKQLDELKHST